MLFKFKDMYGQYVEVHNETSSGNIRIKVKTMRNLNQVGVTSESDMDTETDISLTSMQSQILLTALQAMKDGDEQ